MNNQINGNAGNEIDSARMDVVIGVFCACLLLAYFIGGIAGCPV